MKIGEMFGGSTDATAEVELTALLAEQRAAAEICFGLQLEEVARGRSHARMPVANAYPHASLGILADFAVGRALRTRMKASQRCQTVNMRLDHTGYMPRLGGDVRCEAEVIDADGSQGVVTAVLRCERITVATAVSRFVISSAVPRPPDLGATGDPSVALGTFRDVGVDRSQLDVRVGPEHDNAHGAVHGGILYQGAYLSAGRAMSEVGGAPERSDVLDLTLDYRRPAASSGGTLAFRSHVERRGTRIVRVSGDVVDQDERQVVVFQAALRPDLGDSSTTPEPGGNP